MTECSHILCVLEKQVDNLRLSFDITGKDSMSGEMRRCVRSKASALKLMQLINSVCDESDTKVSGSSNTPGLTMQNDRDFEERIHYALDKTNELMQECATDVGLFEYEIDSVTMKDSNGSIVSIDSRSFPLRKGVRITSYKGKGEKEVVVPKVIEGYPVVCIGAEAFKDSDMNQVVLPSTILAVFSHAFWGCTNLEYIALPKNIRHLGEYCFGTSGIKSVDFPDSISSISTGCCFGCNLLTDVVLGNNTLTIESGAFMNCSEIKSIVLPQSVTRIGSAAFSGTSITQLILPPNMRVIAKDCFSHPYLKSNTNVICIVTGKDTTIRTTKKDRLQGFAMFYCHPGSEIENIAHINKIPIKPISEFRTEENQ